MELELKHLAPYLPYGVKIQGQTHGDIEELTMLSENAIYVKSQNTTYYGAWADIMDIKPILRPLSDLTEIFYWDNLQDGDCELDRERINEIKNSPRGHLKLYQSNYLFKHHFDIFGLIEKDLAIDINTLESDVPNT